MKASSQTTKVITLELAMDEAQWLMTVMQNPIVSSTEAEPQSDTRMREVFFRSLHREITSS